MGASIHLGVAFGWRVQEPGSPGILAELADHPAPAPPAYPPTRPPFKRYNQDMNPERAIQEAQAAVLAGQPEVARRVLEEAMKAFPLHQGVKNALAELNGEPPQVAPAAAPEALDPQLDQFEKVVRDFPGVPLVRSMGASWDFLGWLLVILSALVTVAFMVNYVPIVPKLMEAGYAKMWDPEFVQSQMPPVIFKLMNIGQVAMMLCAFWLSMDIMDKRGRPHSLLAAVGCSMACCLFMPMCGVAPILIPVQMFVGRKLTWVPPRNK